MAAVAILWISLREFSVATGDQKAATYWLRLLGRSEVWWAAAVFGVQNLAFSTVITWIPFLLKARSPGHVAAVLFAMNLSILGPSFYLAMTHRSYLGSRWFYLTGGACASLGAAGLVLDAVSLDWALAAMVGLGTGLIGIAALTFPSTRDASVVNVAAYSSLMLSLGYAIAFAGPFLGGLLVQSTHYLPSAFLPALVASVAMGGLGLALRPRFAHAAVAR